MYLEINYSGDTYGQVPVTSSKRFIKAMNLTVDQPWRSWFNGGEVKIYTLFIKQLLLTIKLDSMFLHEIKLIILFGSICCRLEDMLRHIKEV